MVGDLVEILTIYVLMEVRKSLGGPFSKIPKEIRNGVEMMHDARLTMFLQSVD